MFIVTALRRCDVYKALQKHFSSGDSRLMSFTSGAVCRVRCLFTQPRRLCGNEGSRGLWVMGFISLRRDQVDPSHKRVGVWACNCDDCVSSSYRSPSFPAERISRAPDDFQLSTENLQFLSRRFCLCLVFQVTLIRIKLVSHRDLKCKL